VIYTNNATKPTSNLPCLLDFTGGNGNYNTCGFEAGLVLKPGETKVFSPASNDRKPPSGNGGPWGADHTLDLQPGYRGSGGHVYPLCETRWRHDPRGREVVFVLVQDGCRSPRVIGFTDYREPPSKKP